MTPAAERVLRVERPRQPLRAYLYVAVPYVVLAGLLYLQGEVGPLLSLLIPLPGILLVGGAFLLGVNLYEWRLTDQRLVAGYQRVPFVGKGRVIPLRTIAGVEVLSGSLAEMVKKAGTTRREMCASAAHRAGVLVHLVHPDRYGAEAFITSADAEGLFHAITDAVRAARAREGRS